MNEPQSKAEENTIIAYDKGYRVVDNEVIGVLGKPRKLSTSGKTHCPRFSIRGEKRKHLLVEAHKLSAYQKYGNEIFNPDKLIRHIDGDMLNIRETNLVLMTKVESELLKDETVRIRSARIASSYMEKYSKEDVNSIINFYNQVKSYKLTMKKFNITSKGTLHYILNKRN